MEEWECDREWYQHECEMLKVLLKGFSPSRSDSHHTEFANIKQQNKFLRQKLTKDILIDTMTVLDFQRFPNFPAPDVSHPITSCSTSTTLPIKSFTNMNLFFAKVFEYPFEIQAIIVARSLRNLRWIRTFGMIRSSRPARSHDLDLDRLALLANALKICFLVATQALP
jgi:hypothetical protein